MNSVINSIMDVFLNLDGIEITNKDGEFVGKVQLSPHIIVHKSWDGSFYAETNVPAWVGPNRRVHTQDVTVWEWYSSETARALGKLGYERIEKFGCIDGQRSSGPLSIL